jgi:hypothetical protein
MARLKSCPATKHEFFRSVLAAAKSEPLAADQTGGRKKSGGGEMNPSAAKAGFIAKAFTYGLKAAPFRKNKFFCNLESWACL